MRFRFGPLVTFALALLALESWAQESPPHRLILKDGSYQLVTKYEVKGNRVRYYSSEREDWEELPNSLVDWPATEKYEKDRATPPPEAAELDKELERVEAPLPEVAPGLRIPEDTGVFLLDNFQGEPQILEINQTAGDINRNTKVNILKGTINPVAGLKQTIELPGAHAAIQSHVDIPALYIKLEDTPPQPANTSDSNKSSDPQKPQQPAPSDTFRILHVEVKGNKRIVGDVKRQVTGKISHEEHAIKTSASRLNGGWLRVTPTETLAPGEYALVEMADNGAMNLYVWDFGVNPKAPQNPNPWKPDAK
ncbi:MAG TPA: hypothetical protein VMS18_00695 [Candidatus Binatia bacterium]|nr:hypothetical protein [Candidatus Binatia bacterium]